MSGDGKKSVVTVGVDDDLFKRIHLLQVAMMQSTSKATVSAYRRQLVELFESGRPEPTCADDLNNLVEFLAFPILASAKRLLSDLREMLSKSSAEQRLREFSDLSEHLLACLRYVLASVRLRNAELFYEALSVCSILLSLRSKTSQIALSEEFFIECLKLVQVLFNPHLTSSTIVHSFYKFSNLTSLGLLVSVFLDLLVESSSFQVRLEALEAFKSISLFEHSSSEESIRIGAIFASFLPGICIKLVQAFLLSQNLKLLNHRLICSSLQLLGHTLAEIIGDDVLDEVRTKATLDTCMPKTGDKAFSNDVKAMIVDRSSAEWLAQSADKVSVLLERLFSSLVLTDNVHVQSDLVKLSAQICNRCYFTLNKFLPSCLRVLVTLDDPNASEASQIVARTLEAMVSKETVKNRLSSTCTSQFAMMSSCVDELLVELPRIMNRQFSRESQTLDDQVRVHHLKLLRGYLRLIGGRDRQLKEFLVANLANLNSLLQALVSCVCFDYKSLDNFYEVSVLDDQRHDQAETINASRMSHYAGLRTYLDDKSIYDELRKICAYLARTDALHLVVDELLTNDMLYLQRRQNRTEIMFLIDLMLESLDEEDTATAGQADHVVKLVLENFLDSEGSLTKSSDEDGHQGVLTAASTTTTSKNRQIIQTCLVLEAISTLSRCQKSSSSHSFLISTIFFTLENYLNPNLLIRAVSTVCLTNLAQNLGYASTQHLLSANYDYIMNDLILRSFSQFRSAKTATPKRSSTFSSHVYILCSLLQISNTDLVPYLDRLVNDYMVAVEAKSFDTDLLSGMCKIIYQMSKSMRAWYPVKVNFIDSNNNLTDVDDLFKINLKDYSAQKKKKSEYTASFLETVREIEDQMDKFKKNQEFLAKEEPEVDQDEALDNEEIEEPKSKKIPMNVQLQTKCLTLCSHLISHPLREIRLAVVDIVRELCVNLAEHTDEFLPIVHKLWSPICKRFLMDDLVVKCKIVQLLFELSVLCPDFLTSRFGKEFLPYLCQFMHEQSRASAKHAKPDRAKARAPAPRGDVFSQNNQPRLTTTTDDDDATYIYSQAYKLQLAVLNNLDKMCVLFEIKELELESLVDTCILPYLDKRQPKKLQQSATSALRSLSLVDCDIVWMCLHYMLPFKSDADALITRPHAPDLCQKRRGEAQLAPDVFADLAALFNQL